MYYETIQIDFNSDEAIYIQLRNQIILGIATSRIQEGDTLPSVRQLADNIGINMHTVNKAYSVLRQEGLLSIDRRKGAVIRIDADKLYAMQELREDLQVILAKAVCKNISKEEVHQLVDEIVYAAQGVVLIDKPFGLFVFSHDDTSENFCNQIVTHLDGAVNAGAAGKIWDFVPQRKKGLPRFCTAAPYSGTLTAPDSSSPGPAAARPGRSCRSGTGRSCGW